MDLSRNRVAGALAAALVVALLAPSLALLLPDCAVDTSDACDNGAPARCAGLWSSRCCDFAAPAAKSNSASQSPLGQPLHPAAVAVAAVASVPGLGSAAVLSRSEGGGLPSALLDTTVLRL